MVSRRIDQRGFALPSVIITSLVMFTVLVAMVGSVASVRVTLDSQYYQALARDAAESGAQHAKQCITNAGYTLNEVLTPAKDCLANVVGGQSLYTEQNVKFRTTYDATLTTVGPIATSVDGKHARVVGKTELLRTTGGGVWKTYTHMMNVQASLKLDVAGDRASNRYWCFGKNAGLDFGVHGQQMPTPVACNTSTAPRGWEGTTVVSDRNGNLNFWSNGRDIYNRDGDLMQDVSGKPNWSQTKYGTTISDNPIAGVHSATQAVVAFPMNDKQSIYGVVSTTGIYEWGRGELYFHKIDMALNGGLGAIVDKNTKLGTGTLYASEALGAMPNADGTGYYVYTTSFSTTAQTISGYLIKTDGTISGPIVKNLLAAPATPSTTICATGPATAADSTYGFGTINFTKDYTKMAVFQGGSECPSTANNGTMYLITPNRSTGALTVNAHWPVTANDPQWSYTGYSADFSPEGKYIYTTQIYPGTLTRYDIQSGNTATIKASEWIVANTLTTPDLSTIATCLYSDILMGGQVRRGPDDRMYIANVGYHSLTGTGCPPTPAKMSYISNPDSATKTVSSIGLVVDGITLPSGTHGAWGLPQMVTVFSPQITIY